MVLKLPDPLDAIPSPEVIREQLAESEVRTQKLRILLDLAERLQVPLGTGSQLAPPARRKAVARG